MSYNEFDPFNYMDLKPQNYKSKQQLISDLEEISKILENITNDWKEREASLQKIGSIAKGNLNKSDIFIKNFNSKISSSLEIQLSDLRSSVMKEACRITSLCARELGLLIEQGVTQLLTQNCLFKISGSANKVISDSSSKCILNIVRYVNSLKVISSICENRTMKSNNVRILCAQCLVNIISYYENNFILKSKDIIEDSIKNLLVDANAEVRSTTRKAFILYKSRFDEEGENLFNQLSKNVQKHIKEDEKDFDSNNFKLQLKHQNEEKYIKSISKEIDDNLNQMNYLNKPKTPEFNLMKKKSSQDNNKFDIGNTFSNKNNRKIKNNRKSPDKIRKKTMEAKKEETVKYINVDDDDGAGGNDVVNISLNDLNDDEAKKDKKEEDENIINPNEESNEINAVFNYSNRPTKKNDNKNNDKTIFNKKNKNIAKNNEEENNKKIENKIVNRNNSKKVTKNNENNNNNINNKNEKEASKSTNIFIVLNDKNKNSNDINTFNIDELINTNKDANEPNSNNNKNKMSNSSRTIKTISDIRNLADMQDIPKDKERVKSRRKVKNFTEINTKTSPNKIRPRKNTSKFEQSETGAIINKGTTQKSGFANNNKKRVKSKEKVNIVNTEINKTKNQKNENNKKISDNNCILSNINKKNKTIEQNTNSLCQSTNFTLNENTNKLIEKMIPKQEQKTSNDFKLDNEDEENELEEEIDKVFDIDLEKNDWTKTYNHRKNNNFNNNVTKKEKINPKTNTYHFSKSNNKNVNLTSSDEYINNTLNKNNSSINNKIDENLLNNESIEDKINMIIDKLDNLINQNEKLILFQYLFNYFNSTLNEIKNFSPNTIKRYIEIHIENLKENDKNLVEQVIKNLMRMIFYMNNIFNTYEIESILKILLFSINDLNDKTITKLSNQLLEIIKKKCDNEELFKSVYSLLGEYNTNFDNCYEFMYLLMPECDNILNNSNYFKQVFRLICLTDNNSKKVGKIIDILYRKYTNNFNQAYEEETPENKKQILMFMEKSNSLYYREFKSNHENTNNLSKNNNEIDNNKIINITPEIKKDSNSNDKGNQESLNSSINKNTSLDSSKTSTLSNNISTKNNIIYTQNNKSSSNINTINGSLNGNNIISINNSNNNNIIITNKLPDDSIPNDLKMSIQNNSLEQYMSYMEGHKSYIPEFVLLLSNKKYNDSKSAMTLLNFTKYLLNSNNFAIDLNACINLMIKQFIYILTSHKKDEKISELIKNILSEMPIYLNSEKCLNSMAKFLTIDNDTYILEILLLGIQNFIIKFKNNKNANKEISLINLLDCFITEVFNLLKHQNSEIRKRAVYCCVEIHFAIGKEFETFLEKIPKNQQNLIKLFIKKRTG